MRQNRAAYYFCRIIICCDIDSRGLVVSVDGSGFWIQDKLCIGNVQGYFGRLPTKVISTEKTLLLFLFSMSTINSICLFRCYPRQAYSKAKAFLLFTKCETKKGDLKCNLRGFGTSKSSNFLKKFIVLKIPLFFSS